MKVKTKRILFGIFVVLLFGIGIFACKGVSDYYWHVQVGDFIMEHHNVPKVGIFSWFAKDLPWIAHEWGSEVLLALSRVLFHGMGPIVYMAVFALLLGLILYLTNMKNYFKTIWFSVVWIVMGAFVMLFFYLPRPHMISYCLFAVTVYLIIDLWKNPASKKLYFLSLLSLIWVNVHGGSSNLPYVLCLVCLFVGSIDFRFQRLEFQRLSKEQLHRYFLVFVLCLLSCFVNPNTYHMVLYPYQNMMDKTMLQTIVEWRSPDIKLLTDLLLVLFPIGFSALTMLISKKKVSGITLVLFLLFTYLSLSSIRFIPLFYIVMTYLIFSFVEEQTNQQKYSIFYLALAVEAVLLFSFALVTVGSLRDRLKPTDLDLKAVAQIKQVNPKRLFNSYGLGGQLIYHNIDVFIDGRADLYASSNYKDAYALEYLEADPSKLIEDYQFDLFVIFKSDPLFYYLEGNESFELIYENQTICLFQPKSIE